MLGLGWRSGNGTGFLLGRYVPMGKTPRHDERLEEWLRLQGEVCVCVCVGGGGMNFIVVISVNSHF